MTNYIEDIKDSPLYLKPEDLEDLPPELLSQLNITESDKKDMYLMKLIEKCGGIISLDKLLIAIYKDSGEIYERNKLMTRLYRMSLKELIYTHPSKKGQYSITKWNTDDEKNYEEEEKDENL
ncbi:hypothetical protein ACWKWF_13425 [Acinetobacter kookii]|jgi:hypothetical protein